MGARPSGILPDGGIAGIVDGDGTAQPGVTNPPSARSDRPTLSLDPRTSEGRLNLLLVISVLSVLVTMPLVVIWVEFLPKSHGHEWTAAIPIVTATLGMASHLLFALLYMISLVRPRKDKSDPLAVIVGALSWFAVVAPIGLGLVALRVDQMRIDASEAPALVRLVPGKPEMEISGTFGPGLSGQVREFLDRNPHVRTVHLTSSGGLSSEGIGLSELIRERKLSTYVSGYCASACTIAFSGGVSRMILGGASMQYHRSGYHLSLLGGISRSRSMEAYLANAYRAGGISQWFIDRIIDTSFTALWYPTEDELTAANVITDIVDEDRFAMGDISGMGLVSVSREKLISGFHMALWHPAKVIWSLDLSARQAIMDIIVESYATGQSIAEMKRRVSRYAGMALKHWLGTADDDVLIEAGHFLYAAMTRLDGSNESRCVDVGMNGNLLEAGAILHGNDFDAPTMLKELVSRTPVILPDEAQKQGSSGQGEIDPHPLQTATCQGVMARYVKALSLPDTEGAAILRALLRAERQFASTP